MKLSAIVLICLQRLVPKSQTPIRAGIGKWLIWDLKSLSIFLFMHMYSPYLQEYILVTYMWTSRREDKFSSFFNVISRSPISSCLLHVHIPNVQFAPCAFRPSKMHLERHTCGLMNYFHSAEVVDSHFKFCFNNFIYQPRVDYFTLGCSLFEYLLCFNSKFQNIYFKIN